jgi:hypothetical protein
MPSAHTVIMVALLPIPIKNYNIPLKPMDEQRQTTREVLKEVLRRVLQPLSFKLNPSAENGQYNVPCADGNFKCCKPALAAWLADCPEYSYLSHRERRVCFPSECSKTRLEIVSLRTSNTPGGITTCIKHSAMPTPRQPMPNSRRAMSNKDSTWFNILPVL